MNTRIASLTLATAALLTACASPRIAQNKTVTIQGQRIEFGGNYDKGVLKLMVNGDPIMSGSFPPFTPTLNLNAKHLGIDFRAECYFGSVLSSGFGVRSIVAGAVQGGLGKSADKCDMIVGDKTVESLFF